jgi:hypothetical protein
VQVEDGLLSDRDRLVAGLTRMLDERYQIGHTTIQLECAGCASNELYCAMRDAEDGHEHDHPHGHHETDEGIDVSREEIGRAPR